MKVEAAALAEIGTGDNSNKALAASNCTAGVGADNKLIIALT